MFEHFLGMKFAQLFIVLRCNFLGSVLVLHICHNISFSQLLQVILHDNSPFPWNTETKKYVILLHYTGKAHWKGPIKVETIVTNSLTISSFCSNSFLGLIIAALFPLSCGAIHVQWGQSLQDLFIQAMMLSPFSQRKTDRVCFQ